MRSSLRRTFLTALLLLISLPALGQENDKPRVLIKTNMGDITVELSPGTAPITVANFLQYVDDGFYDGTIFHRVISNFMIQGGGFTADGTQKPTRAPIKNEADNGAQNLRGTIAMARTNDPDSATAQFFINVTTNMPLNHTSKDDGRTWGYAVFGYVVDGMPVADKIRFVKTGRGDRPVEPVIIESITRL